METIIFRVMASQLSSLDLKVSLKWGETILKEVRPIIDSFRGKVLPRGKGLSIKIMKFYLMAILQGIRAINNLMLKKRWRRTLSSDLSSN